MLHEGLNLMSPEDFAEFSAIKRRMEFLKLRASYLWKYRRANIERAYADVKDGVKLTPTKPEQEEEDEK